MANTVFILGAGASKSAGAPVMKNFLDVAENLLRSGQAGAAEASFKEVFDARSALQQAHSKAELDIHNIESVFAALEMANTIGRFADYKPENLGKLLASMKSLIARTVESTVKFRYQEGQGLVATEAYNRLALLIKDLYERASPTPRTNVAFITFNYDIALDFALQANGVPYFYGGLEESGRIPLLKLHGSINWAHCSQCQKVIPWRLHEYSRRLRPMIPSKEVVIRIGSDLSEFMHCDEPVVPDPVVIPPTWSKSTYYDDVSKVWSAAAKELAEAENIIVIGYSLPLSDSFFRYLYAVGTISKVTLRRFWVFDPDPDVKDRFEELLGPGAKQRFQYFGLTFMDSIGHLKSDIMANNLWG